MNAQVSNWQSTITITKRLLNASLNQSLSCRGTSGKQGLPQVVRERHSDRHDLTTGTPSSKQNKIRDLGKHQPARRSDT